MPKKIVQDIITSNNLNGRLRVSVDARREKERVVSKKTRRSTYNYRNNNNNNKKNKLSKFTIWIIALVSVVFLFFVFLNVFSGTVINLVPIQKQVTLDKGQLVAWKNASDKKLSFKMIIVQNSNSIKIPATEEQKVERKAFGDIVIYNKYSSKSLKLVGRTRFETNDGKIYRIRKSVVIPGTTVKDGKIIPGSATATVYADSLGSTYNIGLVDFTIPGFKGTAMFNKLYARSKTPMSGGISGIVKSAKPNAITTALTSVENSLKETLLTQARSQVPNDFVLYDNAVFFKFNDTTKKEKTSGSSISVSALGKLYGIILNKNKLSKGIAKNFIADYNGEDVTVQNLDKLKFNIINKEKFDVENSMELKFELSGPADVVWDIDKTSLVNSIVGQNKKDFNNIIMKYPSISKAKATVSPFWKKTFPKNKSSIIVKILNSDRVLK